MHSKKEPDPGYRVRRVLSRAFSLASIPYLALGLLLIAAIVGGGHAIEHHIVVIETWIAELGPWGILAYIGLFVLATSLLMPDTVLCILAGALFGPGAGVSAVVIGSLVATVIQFVLAHKLLRPRIQRALSTRPLLAAAQRAVSHNEVRLQLLLRLMPINPATINYVLGAAGVRLYGFLLASLAHTPILLVEVYFGYAGRHAARLAVSDAATAHLHDLAMFGGLAVSVVLMILVSRMARKAFMKALAETDTGGSGCTPLPPGGS